jgi:hypothetical protein
MSRTTRHLALTLALGLAACRIPDTAFLVVPDAPAGADDGSMSSALAIRTSVATLDVDEGGTKAFTVQLTQPPSADLVVRIAAADGASSAAVSLSVPELRFSPASFDQPQAVTVSGLSDVNAADTVAGIALTADGVDPVMITATVRDHDKVEIATDIAPSNVLKVDEGTTAVVKVHLTHQPAGDVRVKVVLGPGPVTVDPAERIFTPATYGTDQSFTFTAPDDVNADNEGPSLTFQATGLADKLYTIQDLDNDTLNIKVTTPGGGKLKVPENGSAPFTVALTQQPAGTTIVHLALENAGTSLISLNHSDLTFTTANYDQPQTVLAAAPTDLNTATESDTISLTIPALPAVAKVTVGVDTVDDDIQGIAEDAPDPLPVKENDSKSFGVTLKFQPTSDITVSVDSLDPKIASATPGTLVFTPQNYNNAAMHQVTVNGADDNNLATDSTAIRLRESTLAEVQVAVSVADDDMQGFLVSKTSLTVAEGQSGSFTVALKFDPGPSTTVGAAITSDNAGALPVDTPSINFTGGPTGSWKTPVTVKVSPPTDTNAMAETAMIKIAAAGVPDAFVSAAVSDPTVVAQYGFPPVPGPFTGSVPLGVGTVLAYRIQVAQTTRLDSFAVYTAAAAAGDFRMALYTNLGGTPGRPGALVAATPGRQAIVGGPNTTNLIPDSADPMVPAGVYWLAIRVSASTALKQDPSATGNDCVTNMTIPSLDSDWPSPFVPDTEMPQCFTHKLVNLWINTWHQ